jgi:hypothetical protein
MSIEASSLSPGMFFQFHTLSKDGRSQHSSAGHQVLSVEAQTGLIKILQLHWAEPVLLDPDKGTLIHLSHGGAEQPLSKNLEIVPIDFHTLPPKQQKIAMLYETKIWPRELVPGEWFQLWHDSKWKQLGYPKQLVQMEGSSLHVYRLESGNMRTYRIVRDASGRLTCDFHRLDARSSAYCDFYRRKQEKGVTLGTGAPSHRELYRLAVQERPYDKDVFLMVKEHLIPEITQLVTDYLGMGELPHGLLKIAKNRSRH